MSRFAFQTDDRSEAFCNEIVDELVKQFAISEQEAVGRVNRKWAKLGRIVEPNYIYHESPGDWAKMIYYGKSSKWWKGGPELKPVPYP
jgi:hypothetical protein